MTALYRERPLQLDADLFLTDGGLETTLSYLDGFDLPHFAAFPLLRTEKGRAALTSYFDSYCDIAARDGLGIVLDAPTWRANPDWGSLLGYDAVELAQANKDAVALVAAQRDRHEGPIVVSGCVGPRGDGYVVSDAMTSEQARAYHSAQLEAFADSAADHASALTLTYAAEAVGIAHAASDVGMPVVVSFTLETDGRLPDGTSLGAAVSQVDDETDSYPLYYMINCAHPTHFASVFSDEPWTSRVQSVRANASEMSHEELDASEDLDRGDPEALAQHYLRLREAMPQLRVVGGCCGTDTEHISAISQALTRSL